MQKHTERLNPTRGELTLGFRGFGRSGSRDVVAREWGEVKKQDPAPLAQHPKSLQTRCCVKLQCREVVYQYLGLHRVFGD